MLAILCSALWVALCQDVFFCAEDVLRLIAHSQPPVHMACGLDYHPWPASNHSAPPILYDNWVTRSVSGRPPGGSWPWFTDDEVALRGMQDRQPFSVFCCWNGLVVMSAVEWWEVSLRCRWLLVLSALHSVSAPRDSPVPAALFSGVLPVHLSRMLCVLVLLFLSVPRSWQYGLRFRAQDSSNVTAGACAASECSHVCEDYWAIHAASTHILLDPRVHVSYTEPVYREISQRPWFDSRPTMGRWTAEDEAEMRRQQLTPHNVESWQCRGLGEDGDFIHRTHWVEHWTDDDKRRRRQQMRDGGWPGYGDTNSSAA